MHNDISWNNVNCKYILIFAYNIFSVCTHTHTAQGNAYIHIVDGEPYARGPIGELTEFPQKKPTHVAKMFQKKNVKRLRKIWRQAVVTLSVCV